jgi:hypothetical protein
VDQLPIGGDFEDAARGAQDFDGGAELSLQLGRQTGGLRVVVSDPAVFDGDSHAFLRSSQLRV